MPVGRVALINKSLSKYFLQFLWVILGRGLLFHSANDKVRGTQWIPACAGMTRLNINFLSRLRCARFRVPIPACAGMTIFVNKNCKKYFDKLLFSEVFIAGQWGIVFVAVLL